jgi:2-amino-4-hydroxy-6-hydroxymethyldihydropteridine diphosphokinase
LDAVIGLGTNLGPRLETLQGAVVALQTIASLRAVSAVYETAPVGPPQPDYLNAAVRIHGTGDMFTLLAQLLRIEVSFGRERRERWGPRTLDLDILWVKDRICDDENLVVPHPRLIERPFAMLPFFDVAPEAVDPRTGQPFFPDLRGPSSKDVVKTSLSLLGTGSVPV